MNIAPSPVTVDSGSCYDGRFADGDLGKNRFVYVKMRSHQLVRRELQPLTQRNIGVIVAPEQLEKSQCRVADVLDVVTCRERNRTNITGLEVIGARVVLRSEHGHPSFARNVELPLVRIRMPMHLAHSAWLYLNERSRDRLGSRKHRGIGDAHGATAAADGFLREHAMTQRVTHWTRADDSISGERSGNLRLKDPEILLRNAVE